MSLDFDSIWKTETMHSMDKFCADDREQLAYYRSQGYFADIPSVYADLGLVTLKKAGRESNMERIMTMNLGLAVEDVATANLMYQKAVRKRLE
jgi:ornithine cyclodeaminase/alanine dehydrogenase-like protein (mu-crystallin family)